MQNLSISGMRLFKACRRAYELRYLEGLRPVETSEAIQTGLRYHELIEALYRDGELPDEHTKEAAMAAAYQKYIYPQFRMKKCEEWLTRDRFVGRADGIAEDGCLVEHKTTSGDLEEYEYGLQWDEQILMYMLLSGSRKVYYTICRKPLLRQKKTETDEEFYQRCVEWYDDDTDDKIRLIEITRTDDEVDDFADEIIRLAHEIDTCGHYYKNTANCRKWGRMCEYASVCLHYDPQEEYTEFYREEKRR